MHADKLTSMALFVLIVGTLGLLSCGGGSGDGGGSPRSGEGVFWYFALEGVDGVGDDLQSDFGEIVAGADGTVQGTTNRNLSGTFTTGNAVAAYSYALADNGSYSWHLPPGALDLLGGGMSVDGRAVAMAAIEDISPTMVALLRMGGTFTPTGLTGNYHWTAFERSPTAGHVGRIGTFTFDGAGTRSTTMIRVNIDGTFPPFLGVGPEPYSISPDGRITTGAFEGGILEGGEVVILSGAISSGAGTHHGILIRETTAANAGSFTGVYSLAGMVHLTTAPDYRTYAGTLTADGAGAYTMEYIENTDGTGATFGLSTNGTYTVGSDGTLTMGLLGDTFQGAVSETGRFASLGGATTPGGDPGVFFLVRR